jgi:hypothetical protein
MPKMRIRKVIARERVMHISWSPDYRAQAWEDYWDSPESHPEPTRAAHPEAFWREVEPAYPVAKPGITRQSPRGSLSRTQLRKRLARAGLSGAKLRATVDRVAAGPTLEDLAKTATRGAYRVALRWDTKQLESVLGIRITRKVLRFVSSIFLVRDEYWDFVNTPAMTRLFEQARSHAYCFVPPCTQEEADSQKLVYALLPDGDYA